MMVGTALVPLNGTPVAILAKKVLTMEAETGWGEKKMLLENLAQKEPAFFSII